jgi:hypothetical protein
MGLRNAEIIGTCNDCNTDVYEDQVGNFCKMCGHEFPNYLKMKIGHAASGQKDVTIPIPDSIAFLRFLGVVYLIGSVIGAIVLFAHSERITPGEYLPLTRVQLPGSTGTDPITITLGIGLILQGLTIAALFTVVAGIAENVFFIRRQTEALTNDRSATKETKDFNKGQAT